ncbi:calpain 2, (m II) large subunit [Cichlidogyrus casuarinus]|uniref:Calpain 2, (M II) large subunit n=1 Tax=Cichlidogyrus casuarinus TaxID=1844966 RepID=A0ABD2QD34_9PLAT
MHENLFNQIAGKVVPPGQNFQPESSESFPYVGMFWFRLWHFGDWIDIVVDDRLPTKNGRLVFLHSTDRVEFWSALIEKAYAKLVGSYEALRGGSTAEAMEDFTGGLTEMVELGKKAPSNLFDIMDRAHARCSLMACSIDAAPDEIEAEGPFGLIMGHAYSITDVKLIRDCAPNTKIRMIRLRNPWGNEREWVGPWSDKSDEWNRISPEERRRIGLTFDNDESDTLSAVSQREGGSKQGGAKRRWEMSKHEGEWLRNATAGGCRNNIETFHMNPQYHVTVDDPDETDERHMGTLIIGLMQKEMREQRREPYTIGYSIYNLPDSYKRGTLLNQQFFRTHASAARSPVFINMREVCGRHELRPGDYVIIPSTFSPNEEAKFMLRIFSEKACLSQELDDVTHIGDASLPGQPLVSIQDEDSVLRLKSAFKVIAGPTGDISAEELRDILNEAFKDFPFHGFSMETARSMIALMDEFKRLWVELRLWKTIFKKFDHDHSGTLNAFELRTVMSNIGFHVSNDIYKAIACRYANRNGQILFDDYVLLLVRLMTVFETFKAQDRLPDGRAVFEAEDVSSDLSIYSPFSQVYSLCDIHLI